MVPLNTLTDSPVAASPDDSIALLSGAPSAVAGGDNPWGFRAILAGGGMVGLLVFLSLSGARHAHAQGPAPAPAVAQSPVMPPVSAPQPAQDAPPPTANVPTGPSAVTAGEIDARLRAPSMVVDLSEAPDAAPAQPSSAAREGAGAGVAPQRLGSDERFAEKVSGSQVETAHATRLANTSLIVPQGSVISAVLETGINSDLPGFARAMVSRDVSGFDGSAVVIPRGSHLIGEYKSGVAEGQSRAFVIWSRLITPGGVSVSLASPGADRLGQGGLQGEANNHFLHRFGAAILLSVINGGVEALANQTSSSGNVNALVIGSPQQATNVASIALQKEIDIPTTVTVAQGQSIRVFIARDLDFTGVAASPNE